MLLKFLASDHYRNGRFGDEVVGERSQKNARQQVIVSKQDMGCLKPENINSPLQSTPSSGSDDHESRFESINLETASTICPSLKLLATYSLGYHMLGTLAMNHLHRNSHLKQCLPQQPNTGLRNSLDGMDPI